MPGCLGHRSILSRLHDHRYPVPHIGRKIQEGGGGFEFEGFLLALALVSVERHPALLDP